MANRIKDIMQGTISNSSTVNGYSVNSSVPENVNFTIDSELDDTSENAIQNKVVSTTIAELAAKIGSGSSGSSIVSNYDMVIGTYVGDGTPVKSFSTEEAAKNATAADFTTGVINIGVTADILVIFHYNSFTDPVNCTSDSARDLPFVMIKNEPLIYVYGSYDQNTQVVTKYYYPAKIVENGFTSGCRATTDTYSFNNAKGRKYLFIAFVKKNDDVIEEEIQTQG